MIIILYGWFGGKGKLEHPEKNVSEHGRELLTHPTYLEGSGKTTICQPSPPCVHVSVF